MPRTFWRTRHKVHLFKLWLVSLLIANHVWSYLPKTPINRDSSQSYGRDSYKFRSLEALSESISKASKNFKNFAFEDEEHSKQNHSSYPSRSQSSLESSSNAFIIFTTNLRRRRTFEEHPSKSFLQISKLYWNQVESLQKTSKTLIQWRDL